jgi:hypothetical protein
MADEKPFSAWQHCKAIQEALSPKPLSAEEAEQRVRGAVLTQLAATGPKGAELAQRLRDADGGPITVDISEFPPQSLGLTEEAK